MTTSTVARRAGGPIFCAVAALGISVGLDQPVSSGPASGGSNAAKIPDEPNFVEAVNEDRDRPHFDDFSWREFIALNWPARPNRRDEADTDKAFGAAAENIVWGTWKSAGEAFPPDPETTRPTKWDNFDAELAALAPTKGLVKDAGKRKILSRAVSRANNRLEDVGQGGLNPKFPLPPLVAQNRTYVRYEVRLNKVAYDFLWEKQYYLRDRLVQDSNNNAKPIAFPDGSIIVKAAWMELQDTDKDRFYHVSAEIADRVEGSAESRIRLATVGLVGFHIARKTAKRPSWIWSTFEHVDNVEPGPGADRASFSKNDPATVYAHGDVDRRPLAVKDDEPLPADPDPVDVKRRNAPHWVTANTNIKYHRSTAVKGTVWKNYRLVTTQWVGEPDTADRELGMDYTGRLFPKTAANTTLETYAQSTSCVHCHSNARFLSFIFTPQARAYTPPKKDE